MEKIHLRVFDYKEMTQRVLDVFDPAVGNFSTVDVRCICRATAGAFRLYDKCIQIIRHYVLFVSRSYKTAKSNVAQLVGSQSEYRRLPKYMKRVTADDLFTVDLQARLKPLSLPLSKATKCGSEWYLESQVIGRCIIALNYPSISIRHLNSRNHR